MLPEDDSKKAIKPILGIPTPDQWYAAKADANHILSKYSNNGRRVLRMMMLTAAVNRYLDVGDFPPVEWIEELTKLKES